MAAIMAAFISIRRSLPFSLNPALAKPFAPALSARSSFFGNKGTVNLKRDAVAAAPVR